MKRFECIGSSCEDHCCHGWQIRLDKEDYEHLQGFFSESAQDRAEFEKGVALKDEGANLNDYAVFNLKENSSCFFEKAGLCGIHSRFGESALSKTCATYPRRLTYVKDHLELTGSLSCPEVARLALLREDAMEWRDYDSERLPERVSFSKDSHHEKPFYEDYLAPIRDLVIQILKREDISTEERIYIIFYFSKKTTPFYYKGISEDPARRLKKTVDRINDQAFVSHALKSYNASEAFNDTVAYFISVVLTARNSHAKLHRYNDLCNKTLSSYADNPLAFNDSISSLARFLTDIWPTYKKRKALAVERFGSRIDLYFRNFCINHWLQDKYTNSENLEIHTQRLVLYFAMIKFLFFSSPELNQLAKTNETHSVLIEKLDAMIVNIVQIFMKSFAHNAVMVKYIQDAMASLKLSHINALLPLLKV